MMPYIVIPLMFVILWGCQKKPEGDCWVALYSEPSYKGFKLNFNNNLELPSLKFEGKKNWRGEPESLWAGPKAEVILYSEPYFKGQSVVIKPSSGFDGTSLPSLGSLKINCY